MIFFAILMEHNENIEGWHGERNDRKSLFVEW